MTDNQRYTRQMIMPQIGKEGQEILSSSKVLIVGAGGIGSTVALYLAASGVPSDVLDFDLVELSNLHRQIIHDETQVGLEKAVSAVTKMSRINSSVSYNSLICKLTPENAMSIIEKYDLVVDATDNIDARYTINDCCVLLRKPFVSGSAVQMDGQITTVIPYVTPCYRCLYPSLSVSLGSCRSCADAGVLGPIPGLIGCLEAIEVIKLLLNRDKYVDNNKAVQSEKGIGACSSASTQKDSSESAPKKQRVNGKGAAQLKPLLSRQVMFDAVTGEFHTFQLPPRSLHCAVCGDHPTVTNMAQSRATLAPAPVCAPIQSTVIDDSLPDSQDFVNNSKSESECVMKAKATNLSVEELSAPASTAVHSPVPVLQEESRISCQLFAKALNMFEGTPEPNESESKAQSKISLIVDVRSAEQFSIARLNLPQVLSFPSLEETSVLDTSSAAQRAEMLKGVRAVQVNVPLSVLKGGRAASERETNQQQVLSDLLRLRTLLAAGEQALPDANENDPQETKPTSTACEEGPTATSTEHTVASTAEAEVGVFVLCRRGIDSVTATQVLLTSGMTPTVRNIEGGLTAWSKEVDTSFLMY